MAMFDLNLRKMTRSRLLKVCNKYKCFFFLVEDSSDCTGRHPMVEALRSDPFVPNSVSLGNMEPRSKGFTSLSQHPHAHTLIYPSVIVITGPNMGGKSSSVRMIAL